MKSERNRAGPLIVTKAPDALPSRKKGRQMWVAIYKRDTGISI